MFLSIKKIPKVSWSSSHPFNFKPKISTFIYLCFGLGLFGLGEGLLIVSLSGASPWTVLAQGISFYLDFSIGTITFFISVGVLLFWIILNQKPGIGTILNALIIAFMIDICVGTISTPVNYFNQILLAFVANLGPGPRDGLMIGLQQKTNLPIAIVRVFLEVAVVSIGFYLGGTVGVGTLLFAFGIGPSVSFGLFLVNKVFN